MQDKSEQRLTYRLYDLTNDDHRHGQTKAVSVGFNLHRFGYFSTENRQK